MSDYLGVICYYFHLNYDVPWIFVFLSLVYGSHCFRNHRNYSHYFHHCFSLMAGHSPNFHLFPLTWNIKKTIKIRYVISCWVRYYIIGSILPSVPFPFSSKFMESGMSKSKSSLTGLSVSSRGGGSSGFFSGVLWVFQPIVPQLVLMGHSITTWTRRGGNGSMLGPVTKNQCKKNCEIAKYKLLPR